MYLLEIILFIQPLQGNAEMYCKIGRTAFFQITIRHYSALCCEFGKMVLNSVRSNKMYRSFLFEDFQCIEGCSLTAGP